MNLTDEERDQMRKSYGVAQVVDGPKEESTPNWERLLAVHERFRSNAAVWVQGDDRAILTGLAKINGRKIMLIGQQKGRTIQERSDCHYGCAHPEGYRKALSRCRRGLQ